MAVFESSNINQFVYTCIGTIVRKSNLLQGSTYIQLKVYLLRNDFEISNNTSNRRKWGKYIVGTYNFLERTFFVNIRKNVHTLVISDYSPHCTWQCHCFTTVLNYYILTYISLNYSHKPGGKNNLILCSILSLPEL